MELSGDQLWERIQDGVRPHLPPHAFTTWVASAKASALTDEELVLEVRNPFHVEWLEDKYGPLLERTGSDVLGRPLKIRVCCASPEDSGPVPALELGVPRPAIEGGPGTGSSLDASLERSSFDSSGRPLSNRPQSSGARPGDPAPALFGRYTFERFVVGGNNQLAVAAARAVADKPGRMYNPLFLYGGVGLGKTHLMHAIGHALVGDDAARRVAYLSSEQFTNELVGAIRRGDTAAFRGRYREMDLLMVDDVHFLQGKESTQEEFFHTFNALYDSQRQIVVTSDRPPQDMDGLEKRLVSRFEWGLVVDLRPPDFETRMAILRKKADDEGLVLEDAVIECIANACTSSVRELEGAVLKLLAVSSVWNQEISPDFARRVLALRRREQQPREPIASPDRIKECIAGSWRVRIEALVSKTRTRNVTEARHVAMYAIREILGMPLAEIGNLFGGRDHSTVLYSIRKVEGRMEEDDRFRERVEVVMRELRDRDSAFHT
ncbi:MAG: chromosomal replication initiator protein DnaA [Gemmatimonadetes bacterium]|nr:chromosomal replication initiator protein DnaA [Gemmatimonadota bacterium]